MPASRRQGAAASRCRGTRGFTLIEALVTLVLLGLLAGVVFPNMGRWYGAVVTRQKVGELGAELQQLPAVAVFLGIDFSLDEAAASGSSIPAAYRLNLPKGWRVIDAGQARFFRSGLCQPGQALLGDGGQVVSVTVTALCDLQVASAAAPR